MRKLITLVASCAALAACGGGGDTAPPGSVVTGEGYSFVAPATWKVMRSERGASATDGDRLVGVTTFRLRSVYRPELWAKLVPELDRVAKTLAVREEGELVASRTVVVGGRRARQYEIEAAGSRAEYTFVLRERTEYQLVCRAGGEVCAEFVASFKLV